jgi:uncharacterized protein involved in response to NO
MSRATGAGAPSEPPWDGSWDARWLLVAPHRLGFFLAMTVLGASAAWWALVQLQRAGLPVALGYAVSPTLVHGAVMGFGFIPLFFAGFLFTAGPRWLGVEGPSARQVLPALVAQAAGWLLWLAGALFSVWVALGGLALAVAVTLRFWRLLRTSPVPDRLHAKAIAFALLLGCLALTGLALAVLTDAYAAADAFIVSGIWAFVVVVYLSVAHRMIPFFTASAVPFVHAWRPGWVLALMLGMAGFEAAAVWIDLLIGGLPAWTIPRGLLEVAAGGVLMWLAFAWGLVKSLKIRLLAMLHLGFLWLGISFALGGAAQLISAATNSPVLPLGALHALTMGCLGSLMLAMVTRVSCGHSGRALVADNFVWSLFWLLQAAVLLRIAGSAPLLPAQALLAVAALAWAVVAVSWGVRYGSWYGRPRADGRPG